MSISPLGLVPYYYDEAANYYKWLRQIKNHIIAYDFVQNEETIIKTIKEEDVFDWGCVSKIASHVVCFVNIWFLT